MQPFNLRVRHQRAQSKRSLNSCKQAPKTPIKSYRSSYFTNEYVKSGEEKALFLWRRIYGETTAPNQGAEIEIPNTAPERYYSITKSLKLKDRDVFWSSIWDLANTPDKLGAFGVTAIFGNAIYTKMEPDRVYIFKISPSGQIYPEVSKYF